MPPKQHKWNPCVAASLWRKSIYGRRNLHTFISVKWQLTKQKISGQTMLSTRFIYHALKSAVNSNFHWVLRDFSLELPCKLWYIVTKESTHSNGGCSWLEGKLSLRTPPILWIRQDRHFYFRLFLLSRKANNATIKLPKVNNKVNIPRKIEMIS